MREPRVRNVEPGQWVWLEEYVMLSSTYYLSCPVDRTVEFGSGLFVSGRPRGTAGKFSGNRKIVVYGAGAVHVRVADNKGQCLVGIFQQSFNVVPLYSDPSALAAALQAAEQAAKQAGRS